MNRLIVIVSLGLAAIAMNAAAENKPQREDPAALNDPLAQLIVELRVASETNFLSASAYPAGGDLSIKPSTSSVVATPGSKAVDPLEAFLRSSDTNVLPQLQAYVQLHPGEARAWRILGDLNFRARNFRDAGSAYQHAYDLDPSDPDTLNNFAANLVMEKKQDRAVELLRDSLLRQPGNHAARFNLACIAAKRGRSDEALKHLQRLETDRWEALRLHISDSDLDSLRPLPAFVELQKRIAAASSVPGEKQ